MIVVAEYRRHSRGTEEEASAHLPLPSHLLAILEGYLFQGMLAKKLNGRSNETMDLRLESSTR